MIRKTQQLESRSFHYTMNLLILFFCMFYREEFSVCAQDFRGDNEARAHNFKKSNNLTNINLGSNVSLCAVNLCIRKCCQKNEIFGEMKCQKDERSGKFNSFMTTTGIILPENSYQILYSELQCDVENNFYRIQLENFNLFGNGSVFVDEANGIFSFEKYCLEIASRDDGDIMVVFVCGPSNDILDLVTKTEGNHIGNFL